MKVVYSSDHQAHDPQFEIYDGRKVAYAETPARIETIAETLRGDARFEFIAPKKFSKKHIDDMHQAGYIDFVHTKSNEQKPGDSLYPSYFITDTYAPIVDGTYSAAKTSVDIALTGAELIRNGEKYAYSMCRPPGHHAEYKSMGGYCYFNNAAIAVDYLSQHGRVAILDIDFHHGNGTQNLFYGRADVLYVSIHGDPAVSYPYASGFAHESGEGAGVGYTINYPLPVRTSDADYKTALQKALVDIKKYSPQYVVVSAGFDTFMYDPIGNFNLSPECYEVIGGYIAALPMPTLIIQEGGYHVAELGQLAHRFLQPFTANEGV